MCLLPEKYTEVKAVTEEQLKINIAKNISDLRKKNKITQAELADALNYSDKSVSKWERGEGIPDVLVLCKIAEIFGVTVNDIIEDGEIRGENKKHTPSAATKIVVPMLSAGLAFLIAAIAFFILKVLFPQFTNSWLAFVWAVPVSCIPLIVFSAIWWKRPQKFVCISALIWSFAISVSASFRVAGVSCIFIISAILQILTILWFIMRYYQSKNIDR